MRITGRFTLSNRNVELFLCLEESGFDPMNIGGDGDGAKHTCCSHRKLRHYSTDETNSFPLTTDDPSNPSGRRRWCDSERFTP